MKTSIFLGIALLGVLILGISAPVASETHKDEQWNTKFTTAREQSLKSGLPILMNFTGSDWCTYCIMLDKNVFSKDAFKNFAKENLILLDIDFPQTKMLDESTRQDNELLAMRYGIRGYPTILITDADGNVLAQTGYQPGDAESYIKHLKELLDNAKLPKPN